MQGLDEPALEVRAGGIVGDRDWALVDPETGHLLTAKRYSALLMGGTDDRGIALPDGTRVEFGDGDADQRLSHWLGRAVHLAGLDEAGSRSFEMTFDPPDDESEYYEIPARAGTFRDGPAVHVITTATLRGCAAARPDLDWDVRRFRPNLVIDVDGDAFVERTWVGSDVAVGEVVLHVGAETVRCAMPLRAQPGGLGREPGLFGAMNELNAAMPNHFGLSCSVVTPGRVAVGDPVSVG